MPSPRRRRPLPEAQEAPLPPDDREPASIVEGPVRSPRWTCQRSPLPGPGRTSGGPNECQAVFGVRSRRSRQFRMNAETQRANHATNPLVEAQQREAGNGRPRDERRGQVDRVERSNGLAGKLARPLRIPVATRSTCQRDEAISATSAPFGRLSPPRLNSPMAAARMRTGRTQSAARYWKVRTIAAPASDCRTWGAGLLHRAVRRAQRWTRRQRLIRMPRSSSSRSAALRLRRRRRGSAGYDAASPGGRKAGREPLAGPGRARPVALTAPAGRSAGGVSSADDLTPAGDQHGLSGSDPPETAQPVFSSRTPTFFTWRRSFTWLHCQSPGG